MKNVAEPAMVREAKRVLTIAHKLRGSSPASGPEQEVR
jgi:hypothetical protein